MKRVIFVETLLFICFCALFCFSILFFVNCSVQLGEWNAYVEKAGTLPQEYFDRYRYFYDTGVTNLCYGLCLLVSSLCAISAMVLIAVFPLPGIKPLVEKLQAKRTSRAAARDEKAEANKQRRIEELQAKLDELQNQK